MTTARIMIVEDERITAEDIRDILTHLGYTVSAVVSSGAEALKHAASATPELVLMDIRIKGEMDGIDTARALRERFDIPVVYLTAHADSGTLERAKEAEPLGYLIKPFQEAELQASIEMALHKQRVDRRSKEKHELLSATLGALGEGVACADQGGRITFMNSAAETWTGWKQTEALGRNRSDVLRLLHPETHVAIEEPFTRALTIGALSGLDEGASLFAKDGTERAVDGTIAPIRDHTGDVTGVVLVFGARDDWTPGAAVSSGDKDSDLGGFNIIVESAPMRQVIKFARRVAPSEVSTILLEGESGTGKDVVAKFVHYHSRRRAEPFLAINCAAIPETLLESELFGYEKGAFTDARAQKRGILELASGGTVFLDEIGELPLALQAKLLRVIEEQSFRRLGGVKDTQVDLRVITATNQDLREALRQGRFRLDLYYRLNVIQMVIPPLRERREDIVPLANHFIKSFNPRFKRDLQGVSPETVEALEAHNWPGNVRELRNTIERAMVLEDSSWVRPASLGIRPMEPGSGPGQSEARPATLEGLSLEDAERTLVLGALEKTGWNQTRAARVLKITRDTLRYKMKKFNLKQPGE